MTASLLPPTTRACPKDPAREALSSSRPSTESRSPELCLPASQSSKEPIEERLLGVGEAARAGADVGASVELVLP